MSYVLITEQHHEVLAHLADRGAEDLDYAMEQDPETYTEADTTLDEFNSLPPVRKIDDELLAQIKAALEGVSNDDEHDALVAVAAALAVEYDEYSDREDPA